MQGNWHHKGLTQTYRNVYRSPHFIFLSTKIFQEWDTSQIHCKCPPGQEFDEKNSTNVTCIDFCSFGTRRAECNPMQNNNETDPQKLCFCRNGLNWDKDNNSQYKCFVGLNTVEFSLSIKSTFYSQSVEKLTVKLAKTQSKPIRT